MSLSRKLQMVGFDQEGYIALFSSGSDGVAFNDIRIDSNDNIYLCGLLNTSAIRGLLAKVDVDAGVIWDTTFGSTGGTDVNILQSVRLTAAEDPVVCGYRYPLPLQITGLRGLVGKHSASDGSQIFLNEFNQEGGLFFGLAVDGSGNIFCSGRILIRTYTNSLGDLLKYFTSAVVKYNSSGVQQSVGEIENNKNPSDEGEILETISTVVTDGSGNLYTGVCVDETGAGTEAVLINKFNSSAVWQTSYKWFLNVSASSAEMYGMDINSSGVIAVVGGYPYQALPNVTGAFCGLYNTSTNAQSYFIRRYSGEPTPAPENNARYTGVRYDSAGNLYLCGTNNVAPDGQSTFVDKYDADLVLQWTKDITSASGGFLPTGIDVDSQGNVYVSGQFGTEGVLLKLPPNGIRNGTYGIFTVSENTGAVSPVLTTGSRTVAINSNTGTSADVAGDSIFAVAITAEKTEF